MAQEGLRPKPESGWNGAISTLMAMCWQEEATARPDFHEISEVLRKALEIATGPGPSLVLGSDGDAKSTKMARRKKTDRDNLLAAPLWKTAQVNPQVIIKGKLIGNGASADVFLATFRKKPTALKVFRGIKTGEEEKCFLEIALTFELRHPNIIAMLAWFHLVRDPPRIGMVLEYGDRGALDHFYNEKTYSFRDGLRVALGAAKGITHMHSFPTPIIHRDLKSPNILVVSSEKNEVAGKIADCGESRRIDNSSTMTHIGSLYWCAPEMLAATRYDESVDTYSFGVVLYEIRMQRYPFRRHKTQGGKGLDMRLAKGISSGLITVADELDEIREVIHPRFLSLIRKCTRLRPRERPPIWACVAELQEILEDVSQMGTFRIGARVQVTSLNEDNKPLPSRDEFKEWMPLSVKDALHRYAESLQDREVGEKLRQLSDKVRPFVERAGWVAERVFNAAHLHRFLLGSEGSVANAGMDVVRCISKRKELGADMGRWVIAFSRRISRTIPFARSLISRLSSLSHLSLSVCLSVCVSLSLSDPPPTHPPTPPPCPPPPSPPHPPHTSLEIISKDYSASTVPHARLAQTFIPHNFEVYMHNGRQTAYACMAQLNMKANMPMKQWENYVLFSFELRLMMADSIAALRRQHTPQITIWNFQGANLAYLLPCLPYARTFSDTARAISTAKVKRTMLLVNFSPIFHSAVSIFKMGLNSQLNITTFDPCDLRTNETFKVFFEDEELEQVSGEKSRGGGCAAVGGGRGGRRGTRGRSSLRSPS